MSYKALYRTYRPQTFEEVAGQKQIVQTLKNALAEKKISHAYLFCGPRGTGKTTMARLFAKALNCEEGFGKQCNHCSNCIAISEGTHPDIIEIDAASNRGIDEVRNLIDKVKYSPIKGKYKVYIIDEVHMMTTEAFNALLKTLEEPPEQVVFILATTEPYKLMPTILSRCQRYDFSKVPDGDLYGLLKNVCQKEKYIVDDEALKLIIDLADGGARDSLSMLDQAIAYSGSKLEVHHIQELFGLSSREERINLLKAIDQRDVIYLTNQIELMAQKGIDIKRLTLNLLDILKDLLIFNTTKDSSILKVINEKDISSLSISSSKVSKMIDILIETLSQYRQVSNIKSLFEISLLKMANLSESDNISPASEPIVREKIIYREAPKPVPAPQPIKEAPKVEKKIVEEKPVEKINFKVDQFQEIGSPIAFSDDDIINIMVQATKAEKKKLQTIWPTISNYLLDDNIGKYASLLKQTAPRIVAKNTLVLESNFKNLVTKINLKENQKGLSLLIEKISGDKYHIVALHHDTFVDLVQKFTNLQQAGKLPSPKPITFFESNSEEKINVTSGSSKTAQFAADLLK